MGNTEGTLFNLTSVCSFGESATDGGRCPSQKISFICKTLNTVNPFTDKTSAEPIDDHRMTNETSTQQTNDRRVKQPMIARVKQPIMSSHGSRDEAPIQHEPAFQKKYFWQQAVQDRSHHGPNHAGFCLHNLETGLYQAMRLGNRHSSSEESVPQARRVRTKDPSEASPHFLPLHTCVSLC